MSRLHTHVIFNWLIIKFVGFFLAFKYILSQEVYDVQKKCSFSVDFYFSRVLSSKKEKLKILKPYWLTYSPYSGCVRAEASKLKLIRRILVFIQMSGDNRDNLVLRWVDF